MVDTETKKEKLTVKLYMSIVGQEGHSFAVAPVIVPADLANIVEQRQREANELMEEYFNAGRTPAEYLKALMDLMKQKSGHIEGTNCIQIVEPNGDSNDEGEGDRFSRIRDTVLRDMENSGDSDADLRHYQ